MLKIRLYEEARKIWNIMSESKDPPDLTLELEVHKKVLSFFQVGDFCYFIFNAVRGEFDYVHSAVQDLFGYHPNECTVSAMVDYIHPEDMGWFLDFENAAVEFFADLPPEKALKYKVRYDLRIQKANGEYLRVMQQTTPLQHDGEGKLLRTLVVHTDVSHLKMNGRPILSFIGLDGEPSYMNVEVKKVFVTAKEVLTKREKEVLKLMLGGLSSREIGLKLSISRQTVD
ncbi:LuxR C-terminal-related transcriptional regulator, partial [Chitinophaga sp.]|uniref:LuxR C-terminal-related transcriptional regulator n=1 Tax=Chitinophaga sp. TaxID=1869181 RepID=UPI002F93441B